jgi:hypothetical protein
MALKAMSVPDLGYVCFDHRKSQKPGEFFQFAVVQQISPSDSLVSSK